MKLKVIKDGVTQREGDKIVARKIGETIELTPEAAAHLLGRGLVEQPGAKPKVKES